MAKLTCLEELDALLTWLDDCTLSNPSLSVTKSRKLPTQVHFADQTLAFEVEKHVGFVVRLFDLSAADSSYEYCQTEHLRMQALYWALGTLHLLRAVHMLPSHTRDEVSRFVWDCFDEESGGFAGNPGHDPHLLSTLGALQVLILIEPDGSLFQKQVLENTTKLEMIVQYIIHLQQSDGSFSGDIWGEIDTRFAYAAVNALGLLGCLDRMKDAHGLADYLHQCRNFDGGFGTRIGAESHAGMVFCCVGCLDLLSAYGVNEEGSMHMNSKDDEMKAKSDGCGSSSIWSDVHWWLAERQVVGGPLDGGLNGRPEKLADVCYSWWVLSAMSTDRRFSEAFTFIDRRSLIDFILKSQDLEDGGISDRPGDMPDVYHTFFAVAALSMLTEDRSVFAPIDAVWALPQETVTLLGLPSNNKKE